MKIHKWTKIALLGSIMGTCFTAGVYAQDLLERVDAYLRKDFHVVVDGKEVALTNPPLIYNNSSYLPVKELGEYLGAVVNWKESNKTIYVNSRIHAEQPEEGTDATYTEIVLQFPYAQMLEYLGGQYPVLVNATDRAYYRLKDLNRMGINTDGLRKAKEKYTGDLYVSEEELKTKWGQSPQITYTTEPVIITGEPDEMKRKALQNYVDGYRYYTINNTTYATTPIIIDALPEENTYEYLLNENGHFYKTTLHLTKTVDINDALGYTVGSSTMEDIQVTKPE
ncbi:stalk domain-containing protein [Paenibacillus hexagrammi]|uniref:Copper amine oxidase N-terminal domain-containing protein n=1 Tax=Paenibacillus hexagrammi TaxID=2908839 RepID=A0ABY3SPW9_9BACL|nr:stalk domain-containing protein [Paenibacillus sp. YPD9-1]UJF35226.1 copper amine oxidase N-terminal domain-containing protein [Paenibacillus sp. YPD9-1]